MLVLTDVSGHLTWPCPPAAPSPASPTPPPTAAIFLFEVSKLQARGRVVKNPVISVIDP